MRLDSSSVRTRSSLFSTSFTASVPSCRRSGGADIVVSADGLDGPGGIAGLFAVATGDRLQQRTDGRLVIGYLHRCFASTVTAEELGAEGSGLDRRHGNTQRLQLGVQRLADGLDREF